MGRISITPVLVVRNVPELKPKSNVPAPVLTRLPPVVVTPPAPASVAVIPLLTAIDRSPAPADPLRVRVRPFRLIV
ncbi:MAG: hypothetical protein U0871_10500 [Gemmataceae bacterium]